MASWQAYLINGLLRFAMKRHGNGPLDLARVRHSTLNPPRRALHIPAGWKVDEIRADGNLSFDVAHRAMTASAEPACVVLYLHGGGYFFGSPKTHRQIIIGMAGACDGPCYGLDYRLAPEHPFPAAVEDAMAAYRWLQAKHPKSRLMLAGDSAGGGLAVVTALAARDQGLPMPAAMVLFSPWTDLAATGRSIESNARSCAMFTPKGIRTGAGVYLGDADPRDPRASPLYADLQGLPPTLVFASLQEILLDDSTRLVENARAAGVPVELILRDGLPHVWPIFHRLLPEGREALEAVTRFARTVQRQKETMPA
jgi:epsilon-lactone hydrolase